MTSQVAEGVTTTQRVVQQARLLSRLVTAVHSEGKLSTTAVGIAALMLHGLEELHGGMQPPGESRAGDEWQSKQATYAQLVARIQHKLAQAVPRGSTVAVVTRGDSALVRLDGCTGWHFPRDPTGVWAGYHPANGSEVLDGLHTVQHQGAQFLAIPATTRWWLDFYPELRDHLETSAETVLDDDDVLLYRLALPGHAEPSTAATRRYDALVADFLDYVRVLVPAGSVILVVTRGDDAWLAAKTVRCRHFPSTSEGMYVGHPADDTDALVALRRGQAAGATYFGVPSTMAWWAEIYPSFALHLRREHHCIADHPEIGTLYELTPGDP